MLMWLPVPGRKKHECLTQDEVHTRLSRKQCCISGHRGGGRLPRTANGIRSAPAGTTRVVALAVRVGRDSALDSGLLALLGSLALHLSRPFLRNRFRSGCLGNNASSAPFQYLAGLPLMVLPSVAKASRGGEHGLARRRGGR